VRSTGGRFQFRLCELRRPILRRTVTNECIREERRRI
jgi:hypothetical protein